MDFAITEIEHPHSMISKIAADDVSEPDNFSKEEGNPPHINQPQLDRETLAILGKVHKLPRHLEKLLPKFDPKTSGIPEDLIKKFILAIKLMNFKHEDVVCRISPYNLRTPPPHGISTYL
jgi:hypothetical protein